MNRLLLPAVLLTIAAGVARAQYYQGPAPGSVPSGITMSTDNFPMAEGFGPLLRPAKNKERVAPLPDPPDLPPPTGPEGSNFFADPSVIDRVTAPPPITRASFAGIGQTDAVPPDPHIAAGPNHIMQTVNTVFRIADKAGNTLKTINAQSWYGALVPGVFVYDPKVIYDHFAGRWVMVWLDVSFPAQRGNYLISVSDDDNPLGVWRSWALPSTVNGANPAGNWADYQGVGFDHRGLYLTSNQFSFGGFYEYVKFRIIDKAGLYAGAPGAVNWTDFWDVRDAYGNSMIGTRPSIIYSMPDDYYFVGNSPFVTSTYMVLYKLSNPLTNPVIAAVNVPVTSSQSTGNAGQPNGADPLEGGGFNGGLNREPVYRDSSLWVVHAVRSGSGNQFSSVRYVRIDVTTDVASEDVAFGAEGYWHIWPALGVDKDNNLAVAFTRTSLSEFPAAAFTWRLDADPPGLRPTEVFRPGVSTYVRLADGRNRWGDYMGVAIDPVDRNDFWLTVETVPAQNVWGTWIHAMRVVPFPGARAVTGSASLDFGRVEAGLSDTLSLTLTNLGSDSLTVTGVGSQQAPYLVLGLPPVPFTVPTYDSLTMQVVFSPGEHGVVLDTLRIVSNDAVNPTLKIPLQGKGVVIGRAVPGVLYASSSGTAGALYALNPTTGDATLIGPTGVPELQGLAVDPVIRELIGVNTTGTRSSLYRLSAAYGDALPMSVAAVANMRAIAFSPGDMLFGGTTLGRLVTINPASGDTATIGIATGITYSGLSFSPTTGVLWGSVRPALVNRDRIYTVSTVTGEATLVGATGDGFITSSIAFGPDGRLYAIKGTGTVVNTLISIDTVTAAGTVIGSTGVTGLLAIAMRADSAGVVGVAESPDGGLPAGYELEQNYPNPFNPSTSIRFGLPAQSRVTLRVFDLAGREVRLLADGLYDAGFHSVVWDGTSKSGGQAASGVYFTLLQATRVGGDGSSTISRKMLLLR